MLPTFFRQAHKDERSLKAREEEPFAKKSGEHAKKIRRVADQLSEVSNEHARENGAFFSTPGIR